MSHHVPDITSPVLCPLEWAPPPTRGLWTVRAAATGRRGLGLGARGSESGSRWQGPLNPAINPLPPSFFHPPLLPFPLQGFAFQLLFATAHAHQDCPDLPVHQAGRHTAGFPTPHPSPPAPIPKNSWPWGTLQPLGFQSARSGSCTLVHRAVVRSTRENLEKLSQVPTCDHHSKNAGHVPDGFVD